MRRSRALALAVAAALLALALPVAATLYLVQRHARTQEVARLDSLARSVLRMSEETRAQIHAAAEALIADPSAPCSEPKLALMRRLDVVSTYLQAIGHVREGRLLCSSLGLHGEQGVALGGPGVLRKSGLRTWSGVHLSFVPGHAVNVYERDGYAVIVNPELLLDVLDREPGLSLAMLGLNPAQVVRSRGEIPPAWLPLAASGNGDFDDGERLVVVRTAPHGFTAALAAAPLSGIQPRVRELGLLLLPLGLALGLLLALAVYLAARYLTSLQQELRLALRRGQFFMLYQPIVDLRTRRCVGAEALIRWRRGDGSLVPPDQFIPAAEQSGQIRAITDRVIELVAADAAALLRRHPALHIGLNLSAQDLEDPQILARLRRLTEAAGIRPQQLMLEATERGFMRSELARPRVAELRRGGFLLAIDDFGTGYSSLAHLERFELDVLKIDKCFVDTLGRDAANSQVALHIIEMAKSLRLRTIAEGVEEEAQAGFLTERGVQFAQGWLFGRPMPIEELERLLDGQSA